MDKFTLKERKKNFNLQPTLSATHGLTWWWICDGMQSFSSIYVMTALHGDVTFILQTERIAPKVQTLLPFDVPTFQDDDTP